MNDGKIYYDVKDVCAKLGVKTGKAYRVIRELNEEVEKNGGKTIRGKVSKKFFEQKWLCGE